MREINKTPNFTRQRGGTWNIGINVLGNKLLAHGHVGKRANPGWAEPKVLGTPHASHVR